MNKTNAAKNIKLQARINFISGIVFLVPIITIFYKYSGLSLYQIILLSNISTFTIFLFELPTSVWADTSGRKKSLIISAICNFISTVFILIFPSFTGFVIAAFFSGLYFSFWSGTGQAFLEENLKILNKEKKFGKKLGHFMSLETSASLITPLIISIILKLCGNNGYVLLAILDVILAFILIIFTLKIKEIKTCKNNINTFKEIISKNYETAKIALNNIISNKKLKILLIYRSLANHVAFLYIISLPILVETGMELWMAGFLGIFGVIAMMLANKYAYKLGEKYSYNLTWVLSTISQGILLILIGLFMKSWIFITIIIVVFNFFEGLWQPSWSHVLSQQTKGVTIATTRSIIFAIFALYTTIGKQILAYFPVNYALIGIGIFILIVNIIFAKKILKL